jgi:hypothetical protein
MKLVAWEAKRAHSPPEYVALVAVLAPERSTAFTRLRPPH